MTMENEFAGVHNVQETFHKALKSRWQKLVFWIAVSFVWSVTLALLWPHKVFDNEFGLFIFVLPWIGIVAWLGSLHAKIRQSFWLELAKKYGWQYDLRKVFSEEKALIFNQGHSRHLVHGISGVYGDLPMHIFEYQYSVGHGKSRQTFTFTVFELKFSGTFPHLYLNYKKDNHTNPPRGSLVAKLSIPKEFEDKFDFYSPKEYEIETLEIFTPDVFQHLLEESWRHDMEFVDGELVMYRKIQLNSLEELDSELKKIKDFLAILAPRLNRLRLTSIGDHPTVFTT